MEKAPGTVLPTGHIVNDAFLPMGWGYQWVEERWVLRAVMLGWTDTGNRTQAPVVFAEVHRSTPPRYTPDEWAQALLATGGDPTVTLMAIPMESAMDRVDRRQAIGWIEGSKRERAVMQASRPARDVTPETVWLALIAVFILLAAAVAVAS